jgi:hypothetical protein
VIPRGDRRETTEVKARAQSHQEECGPPRRRASRIASFRFVAPTTSRRRGYEQRLRRWNLSHSVSPPPPTRLLPPKIQLLQSTIMVA